MTSKQRKLRRRQFDEQLKAREGIEMPSAPKGGWIQSIREALGMSQEALGRRLGISKQAMGQLERAESTESVTVKRLRKAANALDCELVVIAVPRQSLDDTLRMQARKVARNQVRKTGHTMALEQQSVGRTFLEDLVDETAQELIDKGDSRIWE